jgi:hypothetical protein
MADEPNFDLSVAHQHFSSDCFNKAWDLIEKSDRTPEEDEEMIRLSQASIWHWTQREDCTPTNMSVGYWQASRIYAILRQVDNARRYGQLCLETSQGADISPFYLGYAYEALARAEMVAGNRERMASYVSRARETAEKISDPDEKQWLLSDLETIK